MKQYYFKENTPLAFHKFFWYIILPLGAIVSILRIIGNVRDISAYGFNWIFAIDLVYLSVFTLLCVITFAGFFKWRSYAWYGVMARMGLGIAYNIYCCVLYAKYLPEQIGTVIIQAVLVLIFSAVVCLYYYKRRPLFFPGMINNNNTVDASFAPPPQPEADPAENASSYEAEESALPPTSLCRVCGNELAADSMFCAKCGAKVTEDQH